MDQDLPVEMRAMNDIYSATLEKPRFHAMLIGGLALLTVLLAIAGLYSVIAYEVNRRTREIGIRIALGADRASVIRHVMSRSLVLAAIGLIIGLMNSLALTRLMSSMLYNIKPTDPLTFVASALLLFGVVVAACYLPARQATHVDPMAALRCD